MFLIFEATCWDYRDDYIREIIEFPSVLYSFNNNKITYISEFDKFVKPIINPILSELCTTLTKITQSQVDTANTFDIVYNEHYKWLMDNTNSNNNSNYNNIIILTCGKWDIADMLPIELGRRQNLEYYNCYKKYANIKDLFNNFYNKKAGSMINMLTKLNMELEGVHHSGIDDCRNISRIFLRMLKDGFNIKNIKENKIKL